MSMNTTYIVGICLVLFFSGPVAGFFGIAVSKYRANLIHNKEEAKKGLLHHYHKEMEDLHASAQKGDYSFVIGFIIFLFGGWVCLLLASVLPPKNRHTLIKKA